MNNLFISYDLKDPGQSYDRVITAIKGLGSWAKVQYSLWFVRSAYASKEAAEIVRRAQDANDTLIVIDATNNDASWYGIDKTVSDHMQQNWNRQTAGVSRY
jgi:hypothetical protein